MKVVINEISYQFGKFKESLDDLAKDNPDWDIEKLFEKTGVRDRYRSSENETALDLAIAAARKLDNVNFSDIDLCIFVTQSPDYTLPTNACIAQDLLGIKTATPAFDINLGCSGFVYALSVASSMIASGEVENALILCSDTYTKYIKYNDRVNRPLFSDAGSAIIINRSSNNRSNIGPFIYGTDGSGYKNLIVPNSGTRISLDQNRQLYMNGSEVLLFTMANVPKGTKSLLKKAKLSFEDIDLFLFHQASKVVMDNIKRKLDLNDKTFPVNYKSTGNTVSATIPILMKQCIEDKKLLRGMKIVLFGFGVGYSYGGCVIDY